MILKELLIKAAPAELHIKLFKVDGVEFDATEAEIDRLDALALADWQQVFDAVCVPGVVAYWDQEFTNQSNVKGVSRCILHRSVKNPGLFQISTAHIYGAELIPIMDLQREDAADFFRDAPRSARVIIEKVV